MLKVEFDGYPEATAVILETPYLNILGIVECGRCPEQVVIMGHNVLRDEEGGAADQIEAFIKGHACSRPSGKEDLLKAIINQKIEEENQR